MEKKNEKQQRAENQQQPIPIIPTLIIIQNVYAKSQSLSTIEVVVEQRSQQLRKRPTGS